MATIEERADEYVGRLASSFLGFPDILEGGKNGYIVGATEQHEIDIDKACKWIEDHFGESYIEYFKKAMDK